MKKLLLSCLLTLPTLVGCVLKDIGTDPDEDTSKTLSTYSETVKTDANGLARVEVDATNYRSFLVTAEKGSGVDYVALEQLFDPSGDEVLYWEDWYNSKESLTYAFYADVDTVFNWPIRKEDGALANGTYTVVVGAYKQQGAGLYYAPNTNLNVTVQRRKDDDETAGSVKAVVVYTQGLAANATVSAGVEAAVAYWKEIWINKGVSLEVRYESSNLSNDLPFPGYGDGELISEAAALSDGQEIVVIIGESIDGDSGSYLGVSGNIPGALIPTTRSATVVSWLANAGRDGEFSADDIDLFGETLAHEVGHYLGLFHPVEDGWGYWDSISDTEKCTTRNQCESVLGANLMFPYPVCSGFNDCVSQSELTAGQQNVMQHYTGTK